jgi:hypothetical protein
VRRFFSKLTRFSGWHQCTLRYHLQIAQLLCESPLCEPDQLCTKQRVSALHVAVGEGRMEFIECLLRAGASPNVLSPLFGTPLHVAAARNHCNCARLLFDSGRCDVDALTTETGETALMISSRKGHLEFVRLLIAQSANAFFKDTVIGNTCLHEAAMAGHSVIAKTLLEAFPKLSSVRSTLTRETASFFSSFRLQAAMTEGYAAGDTRGFVRSDVASDVTLRSQDAGADDGLLACHRVVLLARCPALSAHVPVDERVWIVPSSLCAAKALPALVEFLYTDHAKLTERGDVLLGQIARAARALSLTRLEQLCVAASELGAKFSRLTLVATPSSFSSDMASALSPRFADVHLATSNADSVPVPAHKFILCQHNYFRALLTGGMSESTQAVVRLPLTGDSAELALQLLVRFLYTGQLALPQEASFVAIDLFELAHSLLIDPLVRRIESMLVADLIDHDNVAQLFVLADTFQSLFLREECFDFMCEQFSRIDPASLTALPAAARAELDRAVAFRAEQRGTLAGASLRQELNKIRVEARRQKP